MKKITILCVYILGISLMGAAQTLDWVIDINGIDNVNVNQNKGESVVVDNSGYIYVTGHFNAIMDFDPGPDTSYLQANGSGSDMYLAKYDYLGNYVWARNLGVAVAQYDINIVLDTSGYIYLTGVFFDMFGSDTIYLNTNEKKIYF